MLPVYFLPGYLRIFYTMFVAFYLMECCGHLSEFLSIKRSDYEDIEKNRKLYTFSTGDKFLHEYDFGSTTETLITIVGKTVRKT